MYNFKLSTSDTLFWSRPKPFVNLRALKRFLNDTFAQGTVIQIYPEDSSTTFKVRQAD
jgi:hypothetical protein